MKSSTSRRLVVVHAISTCSRWKTAVPVVAEQVGALGYDPAHSGQFDDTRFLLEDSRNNFEIFSKQFLVAAEFLEHSHVEPFDEPVAAESEPRRIISVHSYDLSIHLLPTLVLSQ